MRQNFQIERTIEASGLHAAYGWGGAAFAAATSALRSAPIASGFLPPPKGLMSTRPAMNPPMWAKSGAPQRSADSDAFAAAWIASQVVRNNRSVIRSYST
jgi:hypothetical protein